MTIDEMRRIKKELGLSYDRLSALSGVPAATIQKIFSGTTSNPRYDTLRSLEAAFAQSQTYRAAGPASNTSMLRETPAVYKTGSPNTTSKTASSCDAGSPDTLQEAQTVYNIDQGFTRQGSYTIYDREALPEDLRTELIDGVLYAFASPTALHQVIAGEVHRQISNFIHDKNGSCIPVISPIDVQLDRDEKTMLQPDVIIVCNQEVFTRKNIYGAPDFVLEVISPSTRRRDFTKKLGKYENAGVREYWIVDPYQRRILVYFFEDPVLCPAIYPFDAEIPVNLYGGELRINLSEVTKWLPEASQ